MPGRPGLMSAQCPATDGALVSFEVPEGLELVAPAPRSTRRRSARPCTAAGGCAPRQSARPGAGASSRCRMRGRTPSASRPRAPRRTGMRRTPARLHRLRVAAQSGALDKRSLHSGPNYVQVVVFSKLRALLTAYAVRQHSCLKAFLYKPAQNGTWLLPVVRQ